MPDTRRIRISVVAGGAMLMVGAAIVAFAAGVWFHTTWPNAGPLGRLSLLVPFAPLTALIILVAGTMWARSVNPSAMETIDALLCVELIAWSIIALFAGEFFSSFVFLFWVPVNVMLAPWWLLASWLGGRGRRRKVAMSAGPSAVRAGSELFVAWLATLVMCVQSVGAARASWRALRYGLGTLAAFGLFVPLAGGLGTLWAVFWLLHRKAHRHASAWLTTVGVVSVLVYEVFVPTTQLNAWRTRQALRAADVRNVRDAVLRSAKGNPVGVRVVWQIVFPRTVVVNVGSALTPVGAGPDVSAMRLWELDELITRSRSARSPARSSRASSLTRLR
jgi:hypothetical protein